MIEGLDKLLEGTGRPDLPGLYELVQEVLGGPDAKGTFLGRTDLKPQSKRVFRVRFVVDGHPKSLILKRLSPAVAGRIELAAKRWLPAVGMGELGPPLAGSVADPGGSCVWHLYDDLGPQGLDPTSASPIAVRAAVEHIAEIHARFARHPLLGEVRLHAGDLGMSYFRANVRDAVYALQAWPADSGHEPLRQRLLQRLDGLARDVPRRESLVEEWGGPETLLHGDLWSQNVFILNGENGPRARLIDWDHVAVGPFSYDLSTFLLRFPVDRRQSILELYRTAVEHHGWQLPGRADLNGLFETAEYARFVNRIIWPAIALVVDRADWAAEALAEVEQWFEEFKPVLPPSGPVPADAPAGGVRT